MLGTSAFDAVTFDADCHVYRRLSDLAVVPSVTQILKAVGVIAPGKYKPGAKERGRRVHELTELLDLGLLEDADIDEGYEGYVAACRRFNESKRPRYTRIEAGFYVAAYDYAGTIDRVGVFEFEPNKLMVLDFKSGGPEDWHRLQLAAYAHAAGAEKRLCVYLGKSGALRVKPYDSPGDFSEFLHYRRQYAEECEQAA